MAARTWKELLGKCGERELHVYLFLAALAVFVVFKSLGTGTLSGDEAMSANLSWNVLRFGYPTAWDGRNLITNYNNGAEFNGDLIWIFHPWLSFYLGAMSLAIWGKTTFGVRFLYALTGLLLLYAIYRLAAYASRDRRFGFFAMVLAGLSVPLLLLVRQAHYYVLVMLCATTAVLCYLRFIEVPTTSRGACLAGALTLIFYANYLFLLPVAGGMLLHYFLLLPRKEPRPGLLRLGLVLGTVLVLALPWAVYGIYPTIRDAVGVVGGFNHGLYGFFSNIASLLWKLQTHTYPFLTLGLVVLLLDAFQDRSRHRDRLPLANDWCWLQLLWIITGLNILLCALLWQHPWLYYRYALLVIAFGPILCAYHLWAIIGRQAAVGIVCAVLVAGTNWCGIFPYSVLNYTKIPARYLAGWVKTPYAFWTEEENLYGYLTYFNRPGSRLLEFLGDIYFPITGRTEVVAAYLKKHGEPDDVFIDEGVESEILVYATGLRAANKLVLEEKGFMKINSYFRLNPKNAEKFHHLTSYPPEQIRWIISGNFYFPSEYRSLHGQDYRPVPLEAQDYYFNPLQDVDTWHRFHSWDGYRSRFYLYQRRGGG